MSVRRLDPNQPRDFEFTPENLAWAMEQIKKYPEGPSAGCGHPDPMERAGAARSLAAGARDPLRRRSARAWPISASTRSRPSTPCSTCRPSAATMCSFAGRRPACCVARMRSRSRLRARDRAAGPGHARGRLLVDRGRVPGRLRERAHGPDQQRLLRGSRRPKTSRRCSTVCEARARHEAGPQIARQCSAPVSGPKTLTTIAPIYETPNAAERARQDEGRGLIHAVR